MVPCQDTPVVCKRPLTVHSIGARQEVTSLEIQSHPHIYVPSHLMTEILSTVMSNKTNKTQMWDPGHIDLIIIEMNIVLTCQLSHPYFLTILDLGISSVNMVKILSYYKSMTYLKVATSCRNSVKTSWIESFKGGKRSGILVKDFFSFIKNLFDIVIYIQVKKYLINPEFENLKNPFTHTFTMEQKFHISFRLHWYY